MTVKTMAGDPVASVWLADYDSIDISLQPLRGRGWLQEADQILAACSALRPSSLRRRIRLSQRRMYWLIGTYLGEY